MIDALLALPPHLARRLAAELATGLLPWPPPPEALSPVLGSGRRETAAGVAEALSRIAGAGGSPRSTAAWLRATAAHGREPLPVDLVWSGPRVDGLVARETAAAWRTLVASARRSLWVGTYAFFDGPRAFELLARRLDAAPQLELWLLLNVARRRGVTTRAGDLVERFAHRFWSREWPGRRRPRVFYDPRALAPDAPTGVFHAKAAVADDELLLVTSANLTEAAFERNVELGVLVRDRTLARTAVDHLQALIDRGVLAPLPQR